MRKLLFSDKGTEGKPDVCLYTWTMNHESFGYVVFKAYLSYPDRGTGVGRFIHGSGAQREAWDEGHGHINAT